MIESADFSTNLRLNEGDEIFLAPLDAEGLRAQRTRTALVSLL
jgi:hypothetical protein